MEINQLKYFVAIYETGGFSKAAKRCFVSQPSLSQQIIKLEKECGGRLFDRLKKKVVPTELGQILYPQARTVLDGIDKIHRTVIQPDKVTTHHLTVGVLPTIAPFVLPATLATFREQLPGVQLSIVEDMTVPLLESLARAEIDVAIMSLPIGAKHIRYEHLYDEPFIVVLPVDHPLTKKEKITVKEIQSNPFIALDRRHCLGEQVESFCCTKQINPSIICRTSQVSTIQDCVSRDLGIALVPYLVATLDKDPSRVYRRMQTHEPIRPIVAAFLDSRTEASAARVFVEAVKEMAQEALKIRLS